MSFQRPTTEGNLAERALYNASPRERRMSVVSEFVTIYGEAPSGAHEAEPRWTIWRETKDASGRITVDFAQDGRNDLYWIYNSVAFNPVADASGRPYYIELDNNIVLDGMVAGLPVANITVLDVDDATHALSLVFDPFNKFTIMGSVLVLTDTVFLVDIAYPIKIRATDPDGNQYDQTFAIYVQDTLPPVAGDFVGEFNLFDEESTVGASTSVQLLEYTVPVSRALRLRLVEVFGMNKGNYWITINGDIQARKETYYTRFETSFNFDNYELKSGDVLRVHAENKGTNTAYFNARIRGYQYAI